MGPVCNPGGKIRSPRGNG